MRRALLLLAALLTAAAGTPAAPAAPAPAAAPPAAPAQDTVVAYHLAPAQGEQIDVLVSFQAGGRSLRIDLPDQTYLIARFDTSELTLVVPADRTGAEIPWAGGPQQLFLPDEHLSYAKRGEATIAGQRCTQWEAVKEPSHNQVCVTGSGILLRHQFQSPQGRRSLVEALGVQAKPLGNTVFDVPVGFERLRPRGGGR